jgi:preprotein translocase subunit YajC
MLLSFISPAYAQAANPNALSSIAQFAPLILIFVVFYFLLIHPQQQRQKELKQALRQLKRGDRVVTAGGILATVQKVREDSNEVELEIAPNVRVTALKETISSVLKRPAAADAKPPAKTAGD